MVEGARLESEYTAKPYRGFESLPLRHSSYEIIYLFLFFREAAVLSAMMLPSNPLNGTFA